MDDSQKHQTESDKPRAEQYPPHVCVPWRGRGGELGMCIHCKGQSEAQRLEAISSKECGSAEANSVCASPELERGQPDLPCAIPRSQSSR